MSMRDWLIATEDLVYVIKYTWSNNNRMSFWDKNFVPMTADHAARIWCIWFEQYVQDNKISADLSISASSFTIAHDWYQHVRERHAKSATLSFDPEWNDNLAIRNTTIVLIQDLLYATLDHCLQQQVQSVLRRPVGNQTLREQLQRRA